MNEPTQSPHRRAWDLIPWVVAGSASESDRQLVAQHAAACAECRAELAFHRSLRAGMVRGAGGGAAADAPGSEAPMPDPGPALQRLWARIDRAEEVEGAANTEPAVPPRTAARAGGWTRWLVAAAVLQAIGLAALSGALWERPRAADYQTLSRPALPGSAPAKIRLVPDPALQFGELRVLLARSDLQIVESNSDGTVLGVALLAGGGAADRQAVEEAIQRLRAEPGVLLAEPIVDANAPAR